MHCSLQVQKHLRTNFLDSKGKAHCCCHHRGAATATTPPPLPLLPPASLTLLASPHRCRCHGGCASAAATASATAAAQSSDEEFRGRFKAMCVIENWEATGLTSGLKAYNGKPVLITKSGTTFAGKVRASRCAAFAFPGQRLGV
jgi:hypothetical protein